jgi:hypothetical protein
VHADSIAKAYLAGLARGVSATEYGAARTVRRDRMASFLMNELQLLVAAGRVTPRA